MAFMIAIVFLLLAPYILVGALVLFPIVYAIALVVSARRDNRNTDRTHTAPLTGVIFWERLSRWKPGPYIFLGCFVVLSVIALEPPRWLTDPLGMKFRFAVDVGDALNAPLGPPADDLQVRGQQLQVALQKAYLAMRDSRSYQTNVTDVVVTYIPPGLSFDDAETILRAAGFRVYRPALNQAADVNRSPEWYGVMGSMPFAGAFLVGVTAYVMLLPKAPGDYSSVERLDASFMTAMP